jgi:hypothetical protein
VEGRDDFQAGPGEVVLFTIAVLQNLRRESKRNRKEGVKEEFTQKLPMSPPYAFVEKRPVLQL